jgi:hypothetical protein
MQSSGDGVTEPRVFAAPAADAGVFELEASNLEVQG